MFKITIISWGIFASIFWSIFVYGGSGFAQEHDGHVYAKVQDTLDSKYQIQRHLEAFNSNFDLLLQNTSDLTNQHKAMREPKTQAERVLKLSIETQLPVLEALEQKIKSNSTELETLLGRSANFLEDSGYDGRLLGLKVPTSFPLFEGTTISNSHNIDESPMGMELTNGVREVCFADSSRSTDIVDLFLSTTRVGVSCVQSVQSAELVEDGAASLSGIVELLTGSPLLKEVIENPDPNYQLDFTNAPKLKALFMSYLEFKHDFSGRMMAQIIAHHAKLGTDIRILLPGLPFPGSNFIKAKDRLLLNQLEALGPNVKVRKFIYKESNPDLRTPFAMLTTSQHSKILIAVAHDPSRSGSILGGRNIKDTFYMTKTPDYSKWPELVQYQNGDEKFGVFRDMEVKIKDHNFASQSAAQFLSFWNINSSGPKVIKATEYLSVAVPNDIWERLREDDGRTYVRQFRSLPRVDDFAVQKLFVEMIDKAKSEVILITPYLRPRKDFRDAVIRALRRNVTVQILTTLDLGLDNVAPFTEDMNKMSVNKFIKEYEKIKGKNPQIARADSHLKVFEWRGNSVLHSKVISIDDKLIFVGSINLDQRGFAVDSENGVLLLGPPVKEMRKIYEQTYLPQARPLEGKLRTSKLNRILIAFLDLLNMT